MGRSVLSEKCQRHKHDRCLQPKFTKFERFRIANGCKRYQKTIQLGGPCPPSDQIRTPHNAKFALEIPGIWSQMFRPKNHGSKLSNITERCCWSFLWSNHLKTMNHSDSTQEVCSEFAPHISEFGCVQHREWLAKEEESIGRQSRLRFCNTISYDFHVFVGIECSFCFMRTLPCFLLCQQLARYANCFRGSCPLSGQNLHVSLRFGKCLVVSEAATIMFHALSCWCTIQLPVWSKPVGSAWKTHHIHER